MSESLNDIIEKAAGRAFLKKMKTAGPKLDMAKGMAKNFVRHAGEAASRNKGSIIAGGVGALGAGLLGRAMAKPGKNGEPSAEQRVGRKLTDSAAAAKQTQEQTGVEPGLAKGLMHAAAPGVSGVADLLAKHPTAAGLMVAPAGAMAGLKILKALK
jgi:hypothetical protein